MFFFFPSNLPPTMRECEFPDILVGVQRAIVATGLYTATTCYTSLDDDPDPVVGGLQAVITPSSSFETPDSQVGSGREATLVEADLSIHVIDRHATDHNQRDDLRLNDPDRGLYASAKRIARAINMEFVEDEAGNALTVAPLALSLRATPRRYGRSWEYGGVHMAFRATYWETYKDTN